jgi:lipoprotein-anchoring transpeptidase ErfK/SrfK
MCNGTLWRVARRSLLILLLPVGLAACATTSPVQVTSTALNPAPVTAEQASRYAALNDEPFPVPAVTLEDLKPRYMRRLVDNPTGQPPGTIVVDPAHRFLYLVQEGGKALRYGVGVGKAGMAWSGTANVATKREWPRWTPTQDMIRREPDKYVKWAGGMNGGEGNPLGARALYLFENGKDTLYRIHGTNEPSSIGQAMSSGCIRMMNQDVIDLYRRVPAGTKVVVLPVGPGAGT